jgi:hypothetical protein
VLPSTKPKYVWRVRRGQWWEWYCGRLGAVGCGLWDVRGGFECVRGAVGSSGTASRLKSSM